MNLSKVIAIVLLFSLQCPVSAGESKSAVEVTPVNKHVLALGLKGGIGLPQISSSLDTTFFANLDLIYRLPFLSNRLGLITSLGFSQPTASGTKTDQLLP